MLATMSLLTDLAAALGPRVSTEQGARAAHGRDESAHDSHLPDVVCFPESTADVVAIVNACRAHHVPIVPWGIGSSVEGGALATHGGVCVDLSRMNRVLRISRDDMDCSVQAGVPRLDLNAQLKPHGVFFPIDPGANATIGGMIGTRASGTNAVRYGTMRDNVLALEVVLASGQVIRTGSRARKSSAGYDLTRLFTGAEGTLGIVTEAVIRVHPIPEAIAAAVTSFATVDAAVAAVTELLTRGIALARVELLDAAMIALVNAYSKVDHTVASTLFLEFNGTPVAVAEQSERAAAIARAHGGADFRWAIDEAERLALWQARHNAYHAVLAHRPGTRAQSTDVCVPISALAACIAETQADLRASFLTAPIVGHVGDGNFHVIMSIDPANSAEQIEAARLNERIVMRALAAGGTCTGEHGVGIGKRKFMAREHGPALDVMRALKAALDPGHMMNPGKVI
jgi:D-lactate dehydrogenase (cytochrome)